MYNRYIPGTNGVYERRTVHDPKSQETISQEASVPIIQEHRKEAVSQCQTVKRLIPQGIDLGDLLLLCIVLLLMIDSDEDDILPLLITAAVFLFT